MYLQCGRFVVGFQNLFLQKKPTYLGGGLQSFFEFWTFKSGGKSNEWLKHQLII